MCACSLLDRSRSGQVLVCAPVATGKKDQGKGTKQAHPPGAMRSAPGCAVGCSLPAGAVLPAHLRQDYLQMPRHAAQSLPQPPSAAIVGSSRGFNQGGVFRHFTFQVYGIPILFNSILKRAHNLSQLRQTQEYGQGG